MIILELAVKKTLEYKVTIYLTFKCLYNSKFNKESQGLFLVYIHNMAILSHIFCIIIQHRTEFVYKNSKIISGNMRYGKRPISFVKNESIFGPKLYKLSVGMT